MNDLAEKAIKYVKTNKKRLCHDFCDTNIYKPSNKPLTLFMAGSPGAGKTESSKALIVALETMSIGEKIVRIDADEIRNYFEGYDGTNSKLFQPACNLAVEKLFDFVIQNNLHCILDGTLSSYGVAEKNIKRSISHGRNIGIYYIYQDPFTAWEFTKKRERVEGRHMPKSIFIKDFFQAKENVLLLKEKFGKKLSIIVEVKHAERKSKFYFNTDNIDIGMKKEYTMGFLTRALKN